MDYFWDDHLCQPAPIGVGLLEWARYSLGAGFDDAPAHLATAYRECAPIEIERVRREGGLTSTPTDCRPADFREEMQLLDGFRPKALVERGVSRLGAIYASPALDDVPHLPFRDERHVLALKFDPAEAFVGDMSFIMGLVPFIGIRSRGLDEFRGAYHKYWEGVIGFEDFLTQYAPCGIGSSRRWCRRPEAPTDLPDKFFLPEILVMTKVVPLEHLRLVE
jgi:hypothetical protein